MGRRRARESPHRALSPHPWEAEATNGIGETPRQMAAERGHAEVVELLAGRGAR